MKIIFCDNNLWMLLNFRGTVIRTLASLGHEIILVAPKDEMSQDLELPRGVRHVDIHIDRTGTSILNDWKYYLTLCNIYKKENPDYILHFTIKPNVYGSFAAKRNQIPSSCMVAGLGHVFTEKGIKNKLIQYIFRGALKIPEKVLTLNKSNTRILLERKYVNKNQLVLMTGGEGVDLKLYPQLPYPKNNKPIFLMCCRLLWEKGVREYFEAAKSLKGKGEFWLMGPIDNHPSAIPMNAVDEMVKEGVIKYIPPEKNVIQYLAKANISVLSSYAEGLSRTLMESCSTGRPIICSNIPGCKETVDEGVNGYTCIPKDSQSLREAMEKFLSLSQEEMEAMGRASRVKAEKEFDDRKTIKYYTDILSRSKGTQINP